MLVIFDLLMPAEFPSPLGKYSHHLSHDILAALMASAGIAVSACTTGITASAGVDEYGFPLSSIHTFVTVISPCSSRGFGMLKR